MPSNPLPAALTALLVLTACATPTGPSTRAAPVAAAKPSNTAKSSNTGKASAQPQVVCEWEMPTGSHISKRVCRPVEQLDRQRAATQIDLLRPRATPPPKP